MRKGEKERKKGRREERLKEVKVGSGRGKKEEREGGKKEGRERGRREGRE